MLRNSSEEAARPPLAVEELSKSFPGTRALDGVSLAVRRGEIHPVMGENGAGKSTHLLILSGVHTPDSGRILIDGQEVHLDEPRAASIDPLPERVTIGVWPVTRQNVAQLKHKRS
jgi:ABC-type sugar transport system ATPase subunit